MSDIRGKVIHWLVKMTSQREMGDTRRKVVHWLIAISSQTEMSDGHW